MESVQIRAGDNIGQNYPSKFYCKKIVPLNSKLGSYVEGYRRGNDIILNKNASF